VQEERRAREARGEQGAMEFWLRMTRSQITKDVRAGRDDTLAAFALVNRLFMVAIRKRASGDVRVWNDLLRYAGEVVARHEEGI
jgi:hypothetical protein